MDDISVNQFAHMTIEKLEDSIYRALPDLNNFDAVMVEVSKKLSKRYLPTPFNDYCNKCQGN